MADGVAAQQVETVDGFEDGIDRLEHRALKK